MRSTRSAVEIVCCDRPDALPPVGMALFCAPEAGLDGVFGSAAWYRLVVAEAMAPGASPCFVLVLLDGRAAVLFALQRKGGGAWQSLTTPYSCLYRPLARPGLADADMVRAGAAVAGLCRGGLRLDALDPDWPGLAPLLRGLRQGGLWALRFDHFGNWHEAVPQGWDAYLAGRDGALRATIRRRTARVLGEPGIGLELFRGSHDLARGMAAFEDVYRRSWKQPEPYPGFNAGFMRAMAGLGLLRLGVLWQDKRAIAAQYWVVVGDTASVLKLAHDEAARALSPGTVLTAWMIRGMLADGLVRELDFGRGDDPYKQGWTNSRRKRIGFVMVSPFHMAGLACLLRHHLGRIRHVLRSWKAARRTGPDC